MAWPCWKCVLVYFHTPPTVVFVVYCCVFLLFVGFFGPQPGAGTKPGIFLSLHSVLFVPLFSLLITQSLVHCSRKVQSIQQDSAPCCRWFRHVGNKEFESAPKISLFVLKKPGWQGEMEVHSLAEGMEGLWVGLAVMGTFVTQIAV